LTQETQHGGRSAVDHIMRGTRAGHRPKGSCQHTILDPLGIASLNPTYGVTEGGDAKRLGRRK